MKDDSSSKRHHQRCEKLSHRTQKNLTIRYSEVLHINALHDPLPGVVNSSHDHHRLNNTR